MAKLPIGSPFRYNRNMAIKSIEVIPKKKRGRPATGRDPLIALRVPAETIAEIDKWGGGRLSRSEAIRTLIEIGLSSKRKRPYRPT
jgi:hypothetical protein